MKKELKQTLLAAKVTLILLWPVSAWAATITFGGQISSIPLLDLLMTLVLSTLMGATSLLHAMKEEYKKAPEIPHLWLFVGSHMLGAIGAGLFVFFAAASAEVRSGYVAGAIMLGSFGGHYFLAKVYKNWISNKLPEATP